MIYKSFEIKNFKGIDKVNIDLSNVRIVNLVGLNESGKTSIMEAIHFFYQTIKGEEAPIDKLNAFRPKGIAFTGEIEISAELLFEQEDKDKIRKHWKKDLKKRKDIEIPNEFKYTLKFVFDINTYKETKKSCVFEAKSKTAKRGLFETDNAGWQALIKFIKTNIIPEILFYDDFTFQIPERICFAKTGIPETEEITNKDNRTWQSVVADILKSVDDRLTFQSHVVDNWEKDKDTANNSLSQMERALNEKITSRWSALFGKNRVNFKEIKLKDLAFDHWKILLDYLRWKGKI